MPDNLYDFFHQLVKVKQSLTDDEWAVYLCVISARAVKAVEDLELILNGVMGFRYCRVAACNKSASRSAE